ncbi:MAG: Gx transporter family protein [Eubacteriales bacterium]|nr:Gx transporter family protein [Eubacteriales bacterium]
MQNRKVALYGVLIALAMIFSYIETMIPSIGIPGVKLGLANLAVLAALYLMSPLDAFFISVVRIFLTAITFGNMFALWYSLAGGLLSLAVMTVCKKKKWLDQMGVSIAGGITHNLGQLLVACMVLESAAVFTYLPVLLFSGTLTGALIGLLGGMILRRLPQNW